MFVINVEVVGIIFLFFIYFCRIVVCLFMIILVFGGICYFWGIVVTFFFVIIINWK